MGLGKAQDRRTGVEERKKEGKKERKEDRGKVSLSRLPGTKLSDGDGAAYSDVCRTYFYLRRSEKVKVSFMFSARARDSNEYNIDHRTSKTHLPPQVL